MCTSDHTWKKRLALLEVESCAVGSKTFSPPRDCSESFSRSPTQHSEILNRVPALHLAVITCWLENVIRYLLTSAIWRPTSESCECWNEIVKIEVIMQNYTILNFA